MSGKVLLSRALDCACVLAILVSLTDGSASSFVYNAIYDESLTGRWRSNGPFVDPVERPLAGARELTNSAPTLPSISLWMRREATSFKPCGKGVSVSYEDSYRLPRFSSPAHRFCRAQRKSGSDHQMSLLIRNSDGTFPVQTSPNWPSQ